MFAGFAVSFAVQLVGFCLECIIVVIIEVC
jgi:hypothetical protein